MITKEKILLSVAPTIVFCNAEHLYKQPLLSLPIRLNSLPSLLTPTLFDSFRHTCSLLRIWRTFLTLFSLLHWVSAVGVVHSGSFYFICTPPTTHFIYNQVFCKNYNVNIMRERPREGFGLKLECIEHLFLCKSPELVPLRWRWYNRIHWIVSLFIFFMHVCKLVSWSVGHNFLGSEVTLPSSLLSKHLLLQKEPK